MMEYTVHRAPAPPELYADWEEPDWASAEILTIGQYHPKSSDHRPPVFARMLYDDAGLYLHYRVEDRYVRCLHDQFQDPVYEDSCVEFFVAPVPGKGYFNFEINCGGALLASYIEDPVRTPEGFAKFTRLSIEAGRQIEIAATMLPIVEPEITAPTEWRIAMSIPYAVFEPYVGPVQPTPGATWQGNLYKCGDKTSHPHWGAWAPVGEELNFHAPQHFGILRFA